MKVAVVGAGIYGVTTAVRLHDRGFGVDIFEREPDILQAASGINQYRLHRGYHYPRSKETGQSVRDANPTFYKEYGGSIVKENKHHYCIPKEGSKVGGADFLKFCYESGLNYEEVNLRHANRDVFDVMIKAEEHLFDPLKLKKIAEKKLKERRMNLFLKTEFSPKDIKGYDAVVNCTYANLNHILKDRPRAMTKYQFELCEKPVLKLPDKFNKISLVVMDGPFFCIDPYADTDLHLMGNVVHAIHKTNVGFFPDVPEEFMPLLNRGIVKNPPVTNIKNFLESAAYFIPGIKKAEHVGSMYTIRTVLPNVDHTDERPTIVTPIGQKVINVFSGKVANCVQAADRVLDILEHSPNFKSKSAARQRIFA